MLETIIEAALDAWAGGRWDEALLRYQEALGIALRQDSRVHVADLHRRIGNVYRERGSGELALEAYEASLRVSEPNGLAEQTVSALLGVAAVQLDRGDLPVAEETYLRARALAAEIPNERLTAMADQNLGTVANIRGDVEGALARYESSLEAYLRMDDDLAAARALNCMAMAHLDLEEWDAAESCFTRAYVLADNARDVNSLGGIEINRVELHLKRRRYESARNSCDRAFEIFSRLDSRSGLAEVYKFYGILYRETGKPYLADTHFRTAIEIGEACQAPLVRAEALNEWALVHLREERNREALQCLNDAHRAFADLHARRELLDLDRRLDQMEATYLQVVRAWGESIESKDRYTAGHCERVANYACLLAEATGIGGRDLTWLRMGGYLHDVGKIAIPPEVLNKPGKLTPEEWAMMQSHTVEGDRIVADLNFPWDIRPVVRSHHERWDGSGYPDGLAGEEIPLTARILCLADVYDALTTTRSYRAALSADEALEIMRGDVGRIFDPQLYEVFEALIRQVIPGRDGRFPAFAAGASAA